MTEKTLTTENIKPALDALRGELAPWPVVAKKQDRLNTAQLNAANSGITSSLVAQIIANTAAIRALESAITGTGLRALVVATLPAVGTTGILYIVPVTTYDPETDADVVNYSNEYIWIPVEGGTASEGHYEQVGQTGIVINNGQLTITVNGTSVGTFTANQSGDTTAAITVPTNADYVDRTTDQTVAGVKTFSSTINGTASKAIADEGGTSIKSGYVNVAGNQTVSGDKSFTGSNTFNNILPNATNTYSLGSSSYQWSSVYAQSYYYNGDAWGLDKANEWTNDNQFNGSNMLLKNGLKEVGSANSGGHYTIAFWDKNNERMGWVQHLTEYIRIGCRNKFTNNVLDPNGSWKDNYITIYVKNDGTKSTAFLSDTIPEINNAYNLGTSTNQWKSVYSQTYFYNGTAWGLDKANVWTGTNDYNQGLAYKDTVIVDRTIPSAYRAVDTFKHLGSDGAYWGGLKHNWFPDGYSRLQICVANHRFVNNAWSQGFWAVGFAASKDFSDVMFYPSNNNVINLGTSTNKWKTLNGVNPGALSLPDYANAVSIDTTSWSKTGAMITYTPTVFGWLQITASGGSGCYITILDSGTNPRAGQRITGDGIDRLFLTYPVIANRTYWIYIVSSAIETARIIPCLGNV